ncbi:translation initiation factor IF-2 N-terminal domain-containing protein [Nocardioides sp. STR2]|uniref:Translation initiation factor IF-2 N-terminal domain-containing protein n=1 Tax=Nocardioides pini TaxID=2975053 RepID=A0ABT4CD73_9ACTN|nr:translation initiation factor IF-2 N-terminal domain-containing protein [Nocardioides pini]MCY4725924.1 translation initiation factor IF-2 N-terminal domain-containing protein [Nocardioides pini]
MTVRVHELAKQLGVTSSDVLKKLAELGEVAKSASTTVSDQVAERVLLAYGDVGDRLSGPSSSKVLGWNAGAVRAPSHEDVLRNISRLTRDFPVAAQHQQALARLGSQFFYASPCKIASFEDSYVSLVRFSGAIEAAFGLTREVMFFYSRHKDLQIRTFKAAQSALAGLPREVTPDIMFFWAPDPRLREKVDDWSTGGFLTVPLILADPDDPVSFVSLLRDYTFSRDLFYETTPVRGERFFGRRKLLQSLKDDIQNQRVTGLYGLRKVGKTSVLTELSEVLESPTTVVVLRDLESLPSPPEDPIPELLRDLRSDLLDQFRSRRLRTKELGNLASDASMMDFKRALQKILRGNASDGVRVVLMLDEIEYLTPSDRIDIQEGDMASVAQFLGILRSLVQENSNFTFVLSGLTSAITESGRLYGRPNPLFSWAKSNFVSPFERYEADELALSVGRRMGIGISNGALEALYEATGGHAFLYRHLASNVVHLLPVNVFHRQMDRVAVLKALEDWRLIVAGHMQEMVDHVRRYYPDEAFLLEVLESNKDDFASFANDLPSALGHLLNLGLVERQGRTFELTPVLEML